MGCILGLERALHRGSVDCLLCLVSTSETTCRSIPKSCSTPCDLMDHSPPGASVHGILQARILEWVAISSSRGIFLTQGLNQRLLCLLHWQVDSLP